MTPGQYVKNFDFAWYTKMQTIPIVPSYQQETETKEM